MTETSNVKILIERATKNKDEAAFNKLFSLFWNDVYFFILYRTNYNRLKAEHITSVTFEKVYRKINTFKIEKDFKNWLLAISLHTLKDERKLKQNKFHGNTISIDDIDIIAPPPSSEGIIYQENLEKLLMSLENLKDHAKEIIKLRYFSNKSYKEIANELGVTEGNVRTKIHRAKEKLSKFVYENNC